MHAIHRGMGRMHKMISNMFKKGMKGKKYGQSNSSNNSSRILIELYFKRDLILFSKVLIHIAKVWPFLPNYDHIWSSC